MKRFLKTFALVITVAITPLLPCAAQEAVPPIEDMMSAAEFRAAGLDRLSAAELKILNAWLLQYTLRIGEIIVPPTGQTPAVIESRIAGDFDGWDGETIFKLSNGQIWQQAQYAYHYHYAFMPGVLIYKTDAGYKMQVDGVSATIYVTRLK